MLISIPYKPRPYQTLVHQDKHRFKILVFHRQSGKTTYALNDLIKRMVEDPGVYLYVGPDKGAAKNIIWKDPDVLFKYLPAALIRKTNETELTVYLKPTVPGRPGSVFYVEGAANPEQIQRLRGIKPKHVIFDEYAQMPPNIFTEILLPPLNQNGGTATFISTFKGKNHFYDLFTRYYDWETKTSLEDQDFKAWYLPYYNNEFFTEDQIRLAKSQMTPSQFDQEYGCLPMSGTSNVFPSLKELMTGDLMEPNPQHFYSMGVDLAKHLDYSAVSIIDRNTHALIYQDRWQSDWSMTIEKLIAIRKKYNRAHVTIDSTGVGDPIAELLAKRGVRCDDFKFSSKSKDQLVKKMGIYFSEKKITLPRTELIPNLTNELEQFAYQLSSQGRIKYSAPQGMHDDEVMSLGLAMWYLKDNPITDTYGTSAPQQSVPNLDPFA